MPVLLIVRPVNASTVQNEKDQWFSGLSIQILNFRLSASDKLQLVPEEKVCGMEAEGDNHDKALHMQATHIVQQQYEISRDGKTIHSLFEVAPVGAPESALSFEQDISMENLSASIDSAAVWILSSVGITPDENLKRFFTIPAVPLPHKNLKELGAVALQCYCGSSTAMRDIARQAMAISDKDTRNLLAQYIAGTAYDKAGESERAVKVFNDVLVVIPNHAALYVEICKNLRMCGRYSDVLKYASAAESKAITSNDLLLEGARAFESLGRQQKARRVFEAVLEKDANQPDALLFFAREHIRDGKYEEALNLAHKVITVDNRNGSAYFILGSSLAALGKKAEAIPALEKSCALAPGEAAAGRLLADLYAEKGDFEKAARYYSLILNQNPKFYAGHIKTAEAWEKAGHTKEAVSVLVRAERIFPDSLDLQRRIGLLEYKLGNGANAQLHLERCVKSSVADPDVYMALGNIYANTKRWNDGLAMYANALPLMKDTRPCRLARAKIYMENRNYKTAVSELLDILKEDPAYPKVHRMLADAWYALGTGTEALACYKKARELEGDNVTVQQRIAELCFNAGDNAAAEIEYRRLVKLDAGNASAYFRLAIVSLEQNRESQADAFLATAISLGNADEDTWFRLGLGFDKVGCASKAIAAYKKCCALNPKNEQALLNLAAACLATGAKREAADVYYKVYELNSNKNQQFLARAGLLFEEANEIPMAYDMYKQFTIKGYSNPDINIHLARLEFGYRNYGAVIALLAPLDKKHIRDAAIMRMLGESYFNTRKYAEALPCIEAAAIHAGNDASIIEMLAVSYEALKQYEKARISYANLISLSPDDRKARLAFHIGELFEMENRIDNAITRYRENVARYPDEMCNYERAIALMLERNDVSGSREMLELAISRPSANPAMLKTLAGVCAMQNDKEAAIQRYTEYLKREPGDYAAWFNAGELYVSKNVFIKAAEALSKAASGMPGDFKTQSLLAVSFRKIGNIDEAIAAGEKAHALNPNDSDVLALLAECYRVRKNTGGLIAALTKLCALRPGDFESRYELGRLLLASGKMAEGAAVLEEACAMRPAHSEIRVVLARTYETLNNNAARYAHLRDALSVHPRDGEAQYEMGRYYAAEGSGKKAEKHFLAALEINPNHAPALYEYSRLLAAEGKTEKALDCMERALKTDRFVAAYHVLYAQCAWALKKADAALAAINNALELDAASTVAMSLAGTIYRETGESKKAKEICTRAISLDPNCATCYRTLAGISFEESDYSLAIGYFKRSLEIGGWDEPSAVLLGRAYKMACQDDKARTQFEEVLKKNGSQYEAYYHLINLHIRAGRIEAARQLVAKLKRDQKTVWHHLAAGEMFEIDGDLDAAQISYAVALRLMPDIPEAHSGLGRIDLLKNDYAGAIVNFGKALARDPYNPYLMLDMARAYEGAGEFRSAFEIYQDVSAKYPQVAEAYYRFAQLTGRQKEYMRAVEIVKQGLTHNPKNARLLMGLGHACRMAGRFEEAIDAYQQAVKKDEQQNLDAYLYLANMYSKEMHNEEEAQKYIRKYIKAGGKQDNIQKQMAILEE